MIHFSTEQVRSLLRGTRGVLAFGIVASVAANVLHSLTRPSAASDPTWKIASGAALSALAPLVLFACIELVSRIPIQSRALGAVRLVVTFLVGGFAGWVSYWHMESVSEMLGETGTARYFYPLIIDGMMLVATISLIELGRLARTVETIEALAAEPVVDPELTAKRKAAAAKAVVTSRKNAAKGKGRKRTPVQEIERLEAGGGLGSPRPAPGDMV